MCRLRQQMEEWEIHSKFWTLETESEVHEKPRSGWELSCFLLATSSTCDVNTLEMESIPSVLCI